jgi:hypothetical protein
MREKVLIPAEIISEKDGAAMVRVMNGFGEPDIMIVSEAITRSTAPSIGQVTAGMAIGVMAAVLIGCAGAPKNSLPLIGHQEPIVIQREGIGPLVTIPPAGRWTWHRKPEEVVSELFRSVAEIGAAAGKEHEARVACEAKLPKKAAKK